jgi:elongation factor G
MHEVRGSDGVGATMDSMDLEKERGITIASAATHCSWGRHRINVIDTPGHVDFTIEVERSLRVLDGAVLVLCAVGGVQSQSLTVDRQMRRYGVPRVVFINKCDRVGADPLRVCGQLREQLQVNPILMQLPYGLAEDFEGVIDLVEMKLLRFQGASGEDVVKEEIPENMLVEATAAREEMLDSISMFSDTLTEAILEEKVTSELVYKAVRQATINLQIVPVLMGSAYKNRGVQPLLDAVVRFLPAPNEVKNKAVDLSQDEKVVELTTDDDQPLVALAFKLEDGRYGQLTYLRVYQGTLKRDTHIVNTRTNNKARVGRLVRMHASDMEEIQQASAGDIIAIFGIDCHSGDTFTDGSISWAMTSMHVPEPVISLSIKPIDNKSEDNMSKALQRFTKEDPTFRVAVDRESNQTIIHGMGELHLDIYLERMRREYQAQVETSPPRVAYRECLKQQANFDYTHKKQTGGAGQYGRVAGYLEYCPESDFEFVDKVVGGRIPRQYIPAVEKGFLAMIEKGPLIGAPVVNIRVVVKDGNAHAVDSSEVAFREAAKGAWRQAIRRTKFIVLEPMMSVSAEGPSEFAGSIIATLSQRRGIIIGSQENVGVVKVEAEVPLAEMFGYATVLRSATEGKAEFSMEFSKYVPVPERLVEELIEKAVKQQNKA